MIVEVTLSERLCSRDCLRVVVEARLSLRLCKKPFVGTGVSVPGRRLSSTSSSSSLFLVSSNQAKA